MRIMNGVFADLSRGSISGRLGLVAQHILEQDGTDGKSARAWVSSFLRERTLHAILRKGIFLPLGPIAQMAKASFFVILPI